MVVVKMSYFIDRTSAKDAARPVPEAVAAGFWYCHVVQRCIRAATLLAAGAGDGTRIIMSSLTPKAFILQSL